MRNNRKEDSAFAIELLAALKYTRFAGGTVAQGTLCGARASLAAGISMRCPLLGHCASAIQEINPVVSYCCYLPCLMLQTYFLGRNSGWSWDSNNTSQTHNKLLLLVGTQRQSSRLKCFVSPWHHFIVPWAYSPLLAFPRTPENPICGAQGRAKETASIKPGKMPAAPLERAVLSFAKSSGRSVQLG